MFDIERISALKGPYMAHCSGPTRAIFTQVLHEEGHHCIGASMSVYAELLAASLPLDNHCSELRASPTSIQGLPAAIGSQRDVGRGESCAVLGAPQGLL